MILHEVRFRAKFPVLWHNCGSCAIIPEIPRNLALLFAARSSGCLYRRLNSGPHASQNEVTAQAGPAAIHLCVRSQQLIDVAHPLRPCGTKPLLGADVITAGEEATRTVADATSLVPVTATMWQHVIVSLLWFALSAQWM